MILILKLKKYKGKHFFRVVGLSSIITTIPIVVASCSFINLFKRQNDPIPPNSHIPPPDQPQPIAPIVEFKKTEGEYNNELYKLADEDKLPEELRYDDGVVLNNDGAIFKNYLGLNEEQQNTYIVENLNEFEIPTIAKASIYIRSLTPFSKSNLFKDIYSIRYSKQSAANFFKILKGYLDEAKEKLILKTSKNSNDNGLMLDENDVKQKIIQNFYRRHKQDFGHIATHSYGNYGEKDEPLPHGGRYDRGPYSNKKNLDDYESATQLIKEDGWNSKIENGIRYRTPVIKGKVDRAFNTISHQKRLDNEMFLSREFFEKTLNSEQEFLDVDGFDGMYANKTSTLLMNVYLFDVLYAYVDFVYGIYNTSTIDNDSFDLIEQINNTTSLKESALELEKKMIRYLAVENIVGITTKKSSSPNLQMFPGSSQSPYYVDFVDAYKGIVETYHKYIQPFTTTTTTYRHDSLTDNLFRENFKQEHRQKHNMIGDYLQQVYHIPRPLKLSSDQVEPAFDKLKDFFKTNLNGKGRGI